MTYLLVTLPLLLAPTTVGQIKLPLRGIVVTQQGQPVVGVTVEGGVLKTCCPRRREVTTTNEKGAFRLTHPGAVIHFSKEGFALETLVVKPGTKAVRIIINTSPNDWVVPSCGQPGREQKRIGWGRYGLQFTVSEKAVEIHGGKPDADYVRYVIKSKRGGSYLELWFGPMAMPGEPEDEQFINSTDFVQRNLVAAGGGLIGTDSWGHLRSGRSWRHLGIIGEGGAIYRNATPEDANLFDDIISSICTLPRPTK